MEKDEKVINEIAINEDFLKLLNDIKGQISTNNEAVIICKKAMLELIDLISFQQTSIKNFKDEFDKIKENIISLNKDIELLKDTIDIYKKRDIEQTSRIRSLESNEKFDYIANIVSEFIRIRDIVVKKAQTDNDDLKEFYNQIIKHLDVSLSRCNVYSYQTAVEEKFNPEIHAGIKSIETSEKQLVGKIAQSVSNGYYVEYSVDNEIKRKIINYEKVYFYEYKK